MAGDVVIGLKVQGELSQARQQVKSLAAEVQQLNKAAQNGTSLSGQSSMATKAARSASDAAASLSKYGRSLDEAGKKSNDVTKKQWAFQRAISGVAKETNRLSGSMGGLGRVMGGVSAGFVKTLNPLILVGAAAAGLASAYIKGSQEAQRFNQALISTGNVAGQTAGSLQSMAAGISASVGSQRQASDAITALVSTGVNFGTNLSRYSQSAVQAQRSLGQATEETTQHFVDLSKAPVQASLALNERMNYLTLAVYEQIRALEEQGRTQEAATLAMNTYADAVDSRSAQVVQRLGYIERAWRGLKDGAEAAVDGLMSIGRDLPEIDAARVKLERMENSRSMLAARGIVSQSTLDNLQKSIDAQQAIINNMEQQLAIESAQIEAEAEKNRLHADGIKASAEFNQFRLQALSNEERMVVELEKVAGLMDRIRAAGGDVSEDDADKVRANIVERYKPKPVRSGGGSKVDQVGAAFDQQQLAMTTQRLQAQQRLENMQAGIKDSQNAATDALEIWLQTNEQAKKLDQARIQTLRDMAAQVDITTQQLSDAAEATDRNERISTGLQDVQIQWLQATGKAAEASAMQIEARFKQLREDLSKAGNTDGLGMIDTLINVQQAQTELQKLQQQAQQLQTRQNQEEQSIQLRLQSGLITEFESRRQLVDLHRQTADEIDALIPKMHALAEATGNQEGLNRVRELTLQMQQLRVQTDKLRLAMENTFENRSSELLEGLVEDYRNAGDLLRNYFVGMVKDMGHWAAKELALEAKSGLASLFNKGADVVGGAGDAGQAAAAASTTAALTTMSASTGLAATALTTLAAAATAAATAQTASAGKGLLKGIASSFATGGYTGAGGKFEPAGIVHKDEWVVPSQVVRQPGMMSLLSAINAKGIGALSNLYKLPGYASGGLVTGASMPSYVPAASSVNVGGSTVDNQINLTLVDDPARIADAMMSKQGVKNFMLLMTRESQKIRQILGT